MNNEAYTSYPSEQEYLLQEGCEVYVLAVEREVQICNEFSSFRQFDGQTITIIHIYVHSNQF